MTEPQLSPQQAAQQLQSQFQNKDAAINELLDKLNETFSELDNCDLKGTDQEAEYFHRKILESEYILTKLRTIVESEAIRVKQCLTTNMPAAIKAMFTNRDSYLTSVSFKLDKIKDQTEVAYKVHFSYNYTPNT